MEPGPLCIAARHLLENDGLHREGFGPSEVRAPAVGVAHAGGERSGLY
jgi:hypothetical protein